MMIKYLLRNIISISNEIVRNIPRTLFSSFGILFLITFLILSISLKDSVKGFLEEKIFGKLEINQIKITPRSKTKFIRFSAKKNEIKTKQIKNIRNIKELENIEKVIRFNLPATIRVGMMGRYLRTDMLISGVRKSFFKNTNIDWENFKPGELLPVILPQYAKNLYNNFAATNPLPELGEKAIALMSMEIIIGRSSFDRTRDQSHKYDARIFGFTTSINDAGIIVPIEFINEFCRKKVTWKDRGTCSSCIMIIADVKDQKEIPAVTKKIEKMGLHVWSQADIAKKTEDAVLLLDIILTFIMAVILILTIIAIFNSYLAITYNRADRLSIQRILGATKLRIILTFILEAAIVGAFYGAAGYFLGYYLLYYFSVNIITWVPILEGLDLRLADHSLLLLALSLSALVSSASALVPAIFASNLNLFNAMKK